MAPQKDDDSGLNEPGGQDGPGADEHAQERSLIDDIETLIEDGKTYLETEANFQKTRAVYVADRMGAAAFFGAVAAAFGFIALIGLTVGLIIALTPVLTTWGASALVVGAELILAVYFARKASRLWNQIMEVLGVDEGRGE